MIDESLSCRYDFFCLTINNFLTVHSDISHELRTVLTEEYANEDKLSDGQIYRKIRNYQFQKQFSLKMRWWTRLSSHGVRNLKQLLQHRELTLAFDAFLKISALLIKMRISTLHKMFAIRCDEIYILSSIAWICSLIARKSYIIFVTSSNSGLICFSKTRSRWSR